MERKIGEIFEQNGEWYQRVENKERTWDCVGGYINPTSDMCRCCSIGCFTPEKNYKKLEKVGNPFACNYFGDKRMLIMQKFKLHLLPVIFPDTPHIYVDRGNERTVLIEVKQKQ